VAEYLLAEMLECQPSEVQQLLLHTSLLDRANGELADLLTDHPGSERILLDLEDANAFVVSLDPARTLFRYHHLFADLLRLELRRRLPEELPVLHRLAAKWFGDHGEIVDAIRHTQAAGDWAEAGRLLADHSFGMALDGQAQTIETLLRAFPPGAITDGPDLPARAGNGLSGPGAAGPGCRPPDSGRNLDQVGVVRPQAPPRSGDRRDTYRRHPYPQHLRQAAGSRSYLSRPARSRDAAALGAPDQLDR
jgi:hypothetical protein